MKSFSYGQTIHAQPLTEKGRENYDRIDWSDGKKENKKDGKNEPRR